jgi:hypothetical protein
MDRIHAQGKECLTLKRSQYDNGMMVYPASLILLVSFSRDALEGVLGLRLECTLLLMLASIGSIPLLISLQAPACLSLASFKLTSG